MSQVEKSQQALMTLLKQAKIAKHVGVYHNKLTSQQVKSHSLYIAVLGLQSVDATIQNVNYGIYAPSINQQAESQSLAMLEATQKLLSKHRGKPFVNQAIGFKQQRTFTTQNLVIWSLTWDWWIRMEPQITINNILKRHKTQVT